MIGITPVGIFSSTPEESRAFYRNVLGCERVQVLPAGPPGSPQEIDGRIVRLERPQVELLSTEYKLLDRQVNQLIHKDHRLILRPRNLGELLNRLQAAGIEPAEHSRGGLIFEDLNGVTWEIRYSARDFLSGLSEAA